EKMVFAIRTSHKNRYLRFRYEQIQTYSHLQASASDVTDSYAQFEVQNSSKHCGLFHIRCRYNNKYFVRWSPSHYWITATAEKPDENESNWTCTLFKRIDIKDGSIENFRLLHVQLGHYATVFMAGAPFDACLFASSPNIADDLYDVFTFVNLNLLFKTCSKLVAFKGNNGKYLGAYTKKGLPYLQFSYDNPDDPKVIHEMFTTSYGVVYIKSNYFGKFWRRGDQGSWILADTDDPRGTNYAAAMFRPTYININVIALLDMANTWHLNRFTRDDIKDCLNSATPDVEKEAVLEILELKRDDDD
ncbi:hypothetical protein RDABS01_039846, partial [Bienertia sinuspersici]